MNLKQIYYLNATQLASEFTKKGLRSKKLNLHDKRIELCHLLKEELPETDISRLYDYFAEIVKSDKKTFTGAILTTDVKFDFENVGNFYQDLIDDMVSFFEIEVEEDSTKDDILSNLIVSLFVEEKLDHQSIAIIKEMEDDTEVSFNVFLERYYAKHEKQLELTYHHSQSPMKIQTNPLAKKHVKEPVVEKREVRPSIAFVSNPLKREKKPVETHAIVSPKRTLVVETDVTDEDKPSTVSPGALRQMSPTSRRNFMRQQNTKMLTK